MRPSVVNVTLCVNHTYYSITQFECRSSLVNNILYGHGPAYATFLDE